MADLRSPTQKQPGEKGEGTFHYNPGNMSGKRIGPEQDSTDNKGNSENDMRAILKALTEARTIVRRHVEGDDKNEGLVIDRLMKILDDGTLVSTMSRLEQA
jgi:hypothetical protein